MSDDDGEIVQPAGESVDRSEAPLGDGKASSDSSSKPGGCGCLPLIAVVVLVVLVGAGLIVRSGIAKDDHAIEVCHAAFVEQMAGHTLRYESETDPVNSASGFGFVGTAFDETGQRYNTACHLTNDGQVAEARVSVFVPRPSRG